MSGPQCIWTMLIKGYSLSFGGLFLRVIFMVPDPWSISFRRARKGARSADKPPNGGSSCQGGAGQAAGAARAKGGVPPRPGRVEVRGPARGCSAAHPSTGGSANSGARGVTDASRRPAANIFELQNICPGLKRHRSPRIDEQHKPELRLGFYGLWDGRERGKRPRIGFP